jgi:hypothetical protein
MAELNGTPVFQEHVRQLEPTDPSHPATWNPNYLTLICNDVFLKARSDISGLLSDGFIPSAGSCQTTFDGDDRISTVVYKNADSETIATVTIAYDDDHGGRVDYVEAVIAGPPALTIRETFSYDGGNNISGSTRTVS